MVTTTRLTHATPASVFAHGPDRNWEDDSYLPAAKTAAGCRDLAAQFLDFDFGDGIDIALAGGRAKFTPNTLADAGTPSTKGMRKDGRNLVAEWQAKYPNGSYVWNATQLAQAGDAPRVLGLFAPQHMSYTADRKPDASEPTLADMTRAAIAHLQRNAKGYVLLVEGGRIDHAHHDGNARRALEETIAFSDAVRAADEATGDDDTLILVTADHAHTMFFAGYPKRGNPILDKVRGISGEDSTGSEYAVDKDGRPYTTLGLCERPGLRCAEARRAAAGSRRRGYRSRRLSAGSAGADGRRNPRRRRCRRVGEGPGCGRGARQRRAERVVPLPRAGHAGVARAPVRGEHVQRRRRAGGTARNPPTSSLAKPISSAVARAFNAGDSHRCEPTCAKPSASKRLR